MKLVTYQASGEPRVGVLREDGVRDAGIEGDMLAVIEAWDELKDRLARHVRRAPVEAEARLLAPLRPRSMRDFLTFEGHLKNAMGSLGRPIAAEWYEVPAYYKGMPDTVIGDREEIPWPPFTDHLDHELELAAVIGRRGRDIPREQAMDHVFGYTIWNDVSARDVQARELPIGMGPSKAKDWDGSNVLGPCLVTADEVDISNLWMSVRVNGETWGEDTTAHMHHRFPDLIAYASQAQTLYPGEVFGSGTASGGSGIELQRQLAPGDLVELEVQKIGVLSNRVGLRA
ncbi:MAG TPA: fumarylacetoacetate hydrolase family protein [Candidatus Binatia bacterium]|nr:fumarylacetoacetate hydrolase family protein [Candidatus Binatia bacterium]